jgi:Protein of unknown function (DUF2950)
VSASLDPALCASPELSRHDLAISGGNTVAGHALVAYRAIHGDTGIMSFMVTENGVVYEADLGEDTLSRALEIEIFDPQEEWSRVE